MRDGEITGSYEFDHAFCGCLLLMLKRSMGLHAVMTWLEVAWVWASGRARALSRDDGAVSALEYALIASLIGLVIIVGVSAFGTNLNEFYSKLSSKVNTL